MEISILDRLELIPRKIILIVSPLLFEKISLEFNKQLKEAKI
jgi:hypothetical protein